MRERQIAGITRRKSRSLTKADRTAPPAPDLVQRDFTAPMPGLKLVGDITCLPTAEGWLYLATVIDLRTREAVGWSMADHMRTQLVDDAIRMAHAGGHTAGNAIFHTDRLNLPNTPLANSATHWPSWTSGIAPAEPVHASTVRMIRCRFGRWLDPCFDWRCCLGVDLSATAGSGTHCRRAGDASR
jgi:transposase InsO family protein